MCPDIEILIRDLKHRIADTKFPENIEPRTDAEFLEKFIRTKDFNIEPALKSFRKYYAFINRNKKLLDNIKPSELSPVLHSGIFLFLDKKIKGAQICVFRINYWKPKEIPLGTLHQSIMYFLEYYSQQLEIQENGIYIICDLAEFRFEHLWRFSSVTEIRKTVEIVLDGIPIRVKGIHYVNTPTLFLPIHNIGLRFVKEKIRRRVHLHFNLQTLHEKFTKEVLPDYLGGDVPDSDSSQMLELEQLLEQDLSYEAYWKKDAGRVVIEKNSNYMSKNAIHATEL